MTTDFCPDAIVEAIRREGLHTVAGAFNYQSGEDLVKKGLGQRRRTRITLICDGKPTVLYLKRYGACKGKCSPAQVEYCNIKTARLANIATMREIIFGEEFGSKKRSYLIVTAVPGDALERCFEHYMQSHAFSQIEMVTCRLALLVRSLHDIGYVHRDLYSCHIFFDDTDPQLYLIDLARMFSPCWRKFRWRVKDLAQLKYSMPLTWIESHWDKFLYQYHRGESGDLCRLQYAIDHKVAFIRRQIARRASRQKIVSS